MAVKVIWNCKLQFKKAFFFQWSYLPIYTVKLYEIFTKWSWMSEVSDPMVRFLKKCFFFLGECNRNGSFEWFMTEKWPQSYRCQGNSPRIRGKYYILEVISWKRDWNINDVWRFFSRLGDMFTKAKSTFEIQSKLLFFSSYLFLYIFNAFGLGPKE